MIKPDRTRQIEHTARKGEMGNWQAITGGQSEEKGSFGGPGGTHKVNIELGVESKGTGTGTG
jgi:hypothetical protein